MKVLFLTNNSITSPLIEWLRRKNDVVVLSGKIDTSHFERFDPDIIISYNYKYLLTEFPLNKIINLHISLLPWNRGADPNLWSFIQDTPKGVTIHLIDKSIDTGDILLQKELTFDERKETLESSYNTLHKEIQKLLIDNWDKIKEFQIPPKPQLQRGSFHNSKDSTHIKKLFGRRLWRIPISELKRKLNTHLDEFCGQWDED